MGDIRIYDPDHVHLPVGSWTDPHDASLNWFVQSFLAVLPKHAKATDPTCHKSQAQKLLNPTGQSVNPNSQAAKLRGYLCTPPAAVCPDLLQHARFSATHRDLGLRLRWV